MYKQSLKIIALPLTIIKLQFNSDWKTKKKLIIQIIQMRLQIEHTILG